MTAKNGSNTDQIATVRTADGRMHVIWHYEAHPPNASLMQTVLAPNGTVGAAQTIAPDWAGVGDPVILKTAGGQLLVFSAATRTPDQNDPLQSG